jgi:hypothetical protein
MWCLGRILPLIIGEWVPEDDRHYHTFLVLRSILDITIAPVISKEKAMHLRELIDEDHQCFKLCYPESSVIPKMHYIVHLPQWILRCGPIVRFWTMRFEARHKLLKKLSSAIGNFINILKSLSQRYQEYQCYHQLNKQNFFRETVSIGKITRRVVKELTYKDALTVKLPSVKEEDVVDMYANTFCAKLHFEYYCRL